MSQSVLETKRRLTKIIGLQQALLNDLNAALLNSDGAAQDQAQSQLRRLGAEQQRLTEELRYAELEGRNIPATPRARLAGKTLREQVLDVLDEVGVPLAPITIVEFSVATTGIKLEASRFASLRRDEEKSARRDPTSRPAWVTPALNTLRLTPIPRLLSSSAWELERRLVGARSLRVIHLHSTLAFLRRFELLQNARAPQAQSVGILLHRYARGVPGAIISASETDPQQIQAVIDAELTAIEAEDLQERRQAASRLQKYGLQQQLWGLPALIEGAAQSERAVR